MATAKEIREDIARSRAYAKKNDYLKTLSCLASAIRGLVTSQVFGAEKYEIQSHLVEALRDLNKMKMIRKLFPDGLKYQKGKEKAFYQTLDRLHKKLGEAMEKARVDRLRKRLAVLDGNLIKAAQLVKAGTPIEGRKLYAKISEYFADIEGIDSDIGNRMVSMGLFQESVPYLRKALDKQNRPSPPSRMPCAGSDRARTSTCVWPNSAWSRPSGARSTTTPRPLWTAIRSTPRPQSS